MLRTRVIPVLLLDGRGLVKTLKFDKPTYVGDPINAVKIFNEKEVDELVILDIGASAKGHAPNFDLLAEIAEEAFMPLAYGGGVSSLDQIRRILQMGFEKIVLNTAAIENPGLVTEAAREFGAQAIVVSIDVKRNFLFKGNHVVARRGQKLAEKDPVRFAVAAERLGAGEILLNSVDHDGTMKGMNTELIEQVSRSVSVPLVAVGGVGSLEHIKAARASGASAIGAGAFFVFQGPHRAVLISYPHYEQLTEILS